jgi:hypothetical protein
MAFRIALNSTSSLKWLRQELHGTRLHGLHRHRHITVSRDKDDRHIRPLDGDTLL